MKTKLTTSVFSILTMFLLQNAQLSAQVGGLDLSFDTDGKVLTDLGNDEDYGAATVVQPDLKIIVVGTTRSSTTAFTLVMRYLPDGNLDSTFDSDGILITSLVGNDEEAHAVALQSDGKIVVGGFGGSSMSNFLLFRLNTDGSLDNTFDNDGFLTTSFAGGSSIINDILIQPDGKIVASGVLVAVSNNSFISARYNSDGSLDTTFDGDGKVTTDISAGDDEGLSNMIQVDGKIVVGGFSESGSNVYFTLVRYNIDGSIDSTFDTDGIAVTTSIGFSLGLSVAIQADGKILLTGQSTPSGDMDFTTIRYNTDGSIDSTFATNGVAITSVTTGNDFSRDVLVQPDGKIVVGGRSTATNAGKFAIICYNSDGTLDTGFDLDGIVTTDMTSYLDQINALALSPDGRLVAVGFSTNNGAQGDVCVARYYSTLNTSIAAIHSELNAISIYPNPFSSEAIVYSETGFRNSTVTLTNSIGQIVVRQESINGQSFRLGRDDLTAGIYFVRIIQDNNVIANEKVVIINN